MEAHVNVSTNVTDTELTIVYEADGVKKPSVSWNGTCLVFSVPGMYHHQSAAFPKHAFDALKNKEDPIISVTMATVRVKFRTSEKIDVSGIFD